MEFGMCVKHDYNGHKSGKLEGLEKHHHGTCAIELDKRQLVPQKCHMKQHVPQHKRHVKKHQR